MGRIYDTQAWRQLPRTDCIVELLLGDAAGSCRGRVHRHHVDPTDPGSRTVEVCAAHHPQLHALLNTVGEQPRRCRHRHATREAREQCERRLNSRAA